MRHHTCTQGPMAYAYQPQLMILIYGRRRDVLLREQKHHHGPHSPLEFLVLASWLLGSAKFARLQRQTPAMFAQMPLFVYRHFTGAVCTTSSDGRFMGMVALFLSNSSDMVRSPTSRSRRPIQNFLPGTTVAIVGVIWAHGTPQGGAWNRIRVCALQSCRLCCGRS
jgi:hypothetical protein